MLAIREPAYCGQGILDIDAMAFGHLGRSSGAGHGGLGASNRRGTEFGQGIEQGLR